MGVGLLHVPWFGFSDVQATISEYLSLKYKEFYKTLTDIRCHHRNMAGTGRGYLLGLCWQIAVTITGRHVLESHGSYTQASKRGSSEGMFIEQILCQGNLKDWN